MSESHKPRFPEVPDPGAIHRRSFLKKAGGTAVALVLAPELTLNSSAEITDIVNTTRPPHHQRDGSVNPRFTVLGTVSDCTITGFVVVNLLQNGTLVAAQRTPAAANWSVSFDFCSMGEDGSVEYSAEAEYEKKPSNVVATGSAQFTVKYP
jgi:hypothetical protein